MLDLNVFVIFIKKNHVNIIIDFMFKLASSKFKIMFIFDILTEHLSHNRFGCIYKQHFNIILNNIDNVDFNDINMFFNLLKCLCFCCCFKYKLLKSFLNRD